MSYVWRSCPHCNSTIEFTQDYRSIDKPYVQCSNCNQLIVLEHQTEWDTKTWFEKAKYVFVMLFSAVTYGVLLPVAYHLLTWVADLPESNQSIAILYGIGVLIFGIMGMYVLKEEIRESRKRLKDPKYRDLLRKIGFDVPENDA